MTGHCLGCEKSIFGVENDNEMSIFCPKQPAGEGFMCVWEGRYDFWEKITCLIATTRSENHAILHPCTRKVAHSTEIKVQQK